MASVPKNLRVVTPDEKPARRKHTVASAAAEGDELDLAYATRARLASAITDEKCPPRDLAALTRRLDDVIEKIKVLEAAIEKEHGGNGDTGDEAFDASAI